MKISMMIFALLTALAANSANASDRSCGELQIEYQHVVVKAPAGPGKLAQFKLSNHLCRPIGITPYGKSTSGYWFADDRYTRWEVQPAGGQQWTAHLGHYHVGVPGLDSPPLLIMQPGDELRVFIEIPPYLRKSPDGKQIRVYVTDAAGDSRSSAAFELAPDIGTNIEVPGLDLRLHDRIGSTPKKR